MAVTADSWTERELAQIEKRLQKEFKDAQKMVLYKANKYFKQFDRLDKIKAKQVEDGTLSQEEYNRWRYNKMSYGNHWNNLVDNLTETLTRTNQIAIDYLNGKTPEIFTVNYNSIVEQINNSPVEGYSFELVNTDTVMQLAKSKEIMLPPPKAIDVVKDKAWNAKKINSVVMQGILQGAAIPEIAKNLAKATCDSNEKAAIRNARTMVTAAENSGRQSAMNRAEASGIIFKKRWIATNDSRTRPSHLAQHGELVDNDEKFSNGLMFPGDWHGKPAEIYNCRCTLGSWVRGFKSVSGKDKGKIVSVPPTDSKLNLSDKAIKAATEKIIEKVEISSELMKLFDDKFKSHMSEDEYQEFLTILRNNPAELKLFETYATKFDWMHDKKGYFQPNQGIHWRLLNNSERDKFETLFHEFGHAVDNYYSENNKFDAEEIIKIRSIHTSKWVMQNSYKPVVSSSDKFLSAMREDKQSMLEYIDAFIEDKKILKEITMQAGKLHTAGLQDFITGIAGDDSEVRSQIKWQHSENYYNRYYRNAFGVITKKQLDATEVYKSLGIECKTKKDLMHNLRDYETSSELWANINAIYARGGEPYENLKKWCPNSCAAFEELIGGIK